MNCEKKFIFSNACHRPEIAGKVLKMPRDRITFCSRGDPEQLTSRIQRARIDRIWVTDITWISNWFGGTSPLRRPIMTTESSTFTSARNDLSVGHGIPRSSRALKTFLSKSSIFVHRSRWGRERRNCTHPVYMVGQWSCAVLGTCIWGTLRWTSWDLSHLKHHQETRNGCCVVSKIRHECKDQVGEEQPQYAGNDRPSTLLFNRTGGSGPTRVYKRDT